MQNQLPVLPYSYGWCPGAESNRRHEDFQSSALPTELPGRAKKSAITLDYGCLVNKNIILFRPVRISRPAFLLEQVDNKAKYFFYARPYPGQQPDH